jgi:hypothetical protein
MTIFEYLAETQPHILFALEAAGLLAISDYVPAPVVVLMRHAAWRRVGRRIRQVRAG